MIQNDSRLGASIRRRAALLLALACVTTCTLLGARAVHAAQCLTRPLALPLLSGPPTWLNPNAPAPLWRAELHDPRWAGAPIYTLCDNPSLALCAPGTANAQFRVLIDGTTLYLAIQNLADDGVNGNDAVFVGVGQRGPALGARAASVVLGGGMPVTVPAGIRRDAIAPAPVPPHLVVSYSASNATTPGSWSRDTRPPGSMPDWIATMGSSSSVATWTGSPGVTWAVTLAIDLTKLGYAAPVVEPVRLFVGSRHVPNVCPPPGVCAQVPLPHVVTTDVIDTPETIVPSNRATWTEFDPSTGCSGIEINPSSIGVRGGPGPLSIDIQACPSGQPWPAGCPGATNRFEVIPHNVPAPFSTSPHAIRAKLRLANWGSTIDSWQHAPWHDMPGIGTPFETADAAHLEPGWQWTGDAAGSPTIQFQCSVADGRTYCPFIDNAAQANHQCMFAELRAQPGTNLAFASSAAYRNMTFANLSSTSNEATLTIQGLQALTGKATARDLYLYVQTRNMPPHSDAPLELRPGLMDVLLRYAENPPPRPSSRRGDDGPVGIAPTLSARRLQIEKFDPVSLADITSGKVTNLRELPPANNPLLLPTLTDDQALGLAWPSYRVYVYYDTGERQNVGGAERATLAPMVPFGYYLKHTGTFFGFEHELLGSGVQLESLGADWYRVHVENESAVVVKTTVSAEEKPVRETPCKRDCPPPGNPPGKVPPKPICFCAAPGLSSPGAPTGTLALLALLAAARARRTRRRD